MKPGAIAPSESAVDLPLFSADVARHAPEDLETEVLTLFDRCAPGMSRYVGSFGVGNEEAEDIVQESFLALFRHLSLRRDRTNLSGWLFQVAHNLTLKHLRTTRRRPAHDSWDDALVGRHVDPDPDPEARLVHDERRRRLWSVVRALPDRERRCLFLRSEGLTYRDIARTLSLSLGTVAKSLTRTMTRLMSADGGQ